MFILLFPAVGLASEQAEQPGIFTGDLGNIIWTLITFLAVVFVLGKFAWKPILTALQKREDFIRDSLGQAKQDREAAEALLKQYSEKLEKASEEAGAVVEEARRDAEETRKRIHAEAKSEGEAMVDRAKREITLARDEAVRQLHEQTIMLATNVAGKMIRKEMNPADHRELLNESLEELGALK